MIRLMGGDKSFVSKLDSLFTMHLPAEFFAQTEDVTEEGLLGGYVHATNRAIISRSCMPGPRNLGKRNIGSVKS